MEPKDMTLGELVSEYIEAYIEFKLNNGKNGWDSKNIDLQLELVQRFNHIEMSIPEKLEWGIPAEMEEAIAKKRDYAEEVKKKKLI